MTLKPQTSEELLDGTPLREFIMLAGKDSVGKSSAIVSLAKHLTDVKSPATMYVIDTENKFKSALRSFGPDAPRNIRYFKAETMNDATVALAAVLGVKKPGDWLAVESMSRIWERAQNLGYETISGVSKAEYLERRPRTGKGSGPIPEPDRFWDIVKGAHDSAFVDLLSQCDDLNVILTTTISKKKEGFYKENADRKALKVELGIDVGMEGAPRLPYFMETLCLLDRQNGDVSCRVLRDNLSMKDDTRPEFMVPDKKSWGPMFFG